MCLTKTPVRLLDFTAKVGFFAYFLASSWMPPRAQTSEFFLQKMPDFSGG
jgi:hypothetical protein